MMEKMMSVEGLMEELSEILMDDQTHPISFQMNTDSTTGLMVDECCYWFDDQPGFGTDQISTKIHELDVLERFDRQPGHHDIFPQASQVVLNDHYLNDDDPIMHEHSGYKHNHGDDDDHRNNVLFEHFCFDDHYANNNNIIIDGSCGCDDQSDHEIMRLLKEFEDDSDKPDDRDHDILIPAPHEHQNDKQQEQNREKDQQEEDQEKQGNQENDDNQEEEEEEEEEDENEGFSSKNLRWERSRRKRLSQHLLTLRSLVPNITKMDRRSVLVDALAYLKSILEETQIEEEKISLSSPPPSSPPPSSPSNPHQSLSTDIDNTTSILTNDVVPYSRPSEALLPTISKIEVEMLMEDRFLLKIVSNKAPGGLSKIQRSVEMLGLDIINASVVDIYPHNFQCSNFLRAKKKGVGMTEEKLLHQVRENAEKLGLLLPYKQ